MCRRFPEWKLQPDLQTPSPFPVRHGPDRCLTPAPALPASSLTKPPDSDSAIDCWRAAQGCRGVMPLHCKIGLRESTRLLRPEGGVAAAPAPRISSANCWAASCLFESIRSSRSRLLGREWVTNIGNCAGDLKGVVEIRQSPLRSYATRAGRSREWSGRRTCAARVAVFGSCGQGAG